MKVLLLLFPLFFITSCFLSHHKTSAPVPTPIQSQHWLSNQLLTHFNPQDQRVFPQRYWVSTQFFSPSKGPVILYICGEYTCPGIPDERLFPLVLAEKFNALVLVLEHRYYGASQPFGEDSWSLDNMKFLTINEALADLAYFINWCKQEKLYGISEKNPWITIGGSYPGALSAWFRYKYPHLTIGALASSAVVETILNFPKFDEQVYISTSKSGEYCPESIKNLTKLAEFYLGSEEFREDFVKSFNAEYLSNQEFLFFFADIFVELVQYGKREFLCSLLKDKTTVQQMDAIRNYSLVNAPPQSYGAFYLANETVDINNDNRQWTYQSCMEVGFFQTFNPNKTISMRSTNVTIDFYKNWCLDSFGASLWPRVDLTNLNLGGWDLEAFNIIFTNGGEVLFF